MKRIIPGTLTRCMARMTLSVLCTFVSALLFFPAITVRADIPDDFTLDGEDVVSIQSAHFSVMTYYGGEDDPLTAYAYAIIRRRFPNVTLSFEGHPEDGGETIKARAAMGTLPDIVLADSGSIQPLAGSGSILVLDAYADAFHLEDFLTQGAIETCLYSEDGHIYQFPLGGVSPVLWYYNRSIFEARDLDIPENFEELYAACAALRDAGIIPCAMFAKEPWPNGAIFDSFALKEAPGGVYALSRGEGKAGDEAYQKALDKLARLVAAGFFQEGCTQTDFAQASELFLSGQSAMFINGSWYANDAALVLGDALGIFESYPTADAGEEEKNRYAATGGGDTCGLTIRADVADADLCAMVAAVYAYQREVAEFRINHSLTVPYDMTGRQTDTPLTSVEETLRNMLPHYTYASKFLHTLPLAKYANHIRREMERLLQGEDAVSFAAHVDAFFGS